MADEQAHLEMADRHIHEAKVRIAGQEVLIENMAIQGYDTGDAEAVLKTFRETLGLFLNHRLLIVAELDRMGAKADPANPA